MLNIFESASLFVIMLLLAAMPSTSVALVVTRSATLGVANGIAVAVGIVLGDLAFVALAVLGLSVIAKTMGTLFVVVKYMGGAYLLWLGYSLLRAKGSSVQSTVEPEMKGSLLVSFLSGLFLTLGDVKAIFFYLSLLPAFVELAPISTADLVTVLFVTIFAVGSVKIAYAIAAEKYARMVQNMALRRSASAVSGGFMIGAGVYLILKP